MDEQQQWILVSLDSNPSMRHETPHSNDPFTTIVHSITILLLILSVVFSSKTATMDIMNKNALALKGIAPAEWVRI